ncbi:hypothetical protein AwErysi_08790 [Erysipelotrichaceae bacterium]|nr:hypothetical protein AwErysi_08790 [Erysipelotrichaceae bacterium]
MANMELMMLKEDIIKEILDFEEIKLYLSIKEKMLLHDNINFLIKEIKRMQKELVNIQRVSKPEMAILLEKELASVHSKLNEIPLYTQFEDASEQAQVILNEISEMISETLNISDL